LNRLKTAVRPVYSLAVSRMRTSIHSTHLPLPVAGRTRFYALTPPASAGCISQWFSNTYTRATKTDNEEPSLGLPVLSFYHSVNKMLTCHSYYFKATNCFMVRDTPFTDLDENQLQL